MLFHRSLLPPKLSVLLPTHNRPDVLSYAIRSVLWQSWSDFELLIVGDGCGDDTRDVVASFRDRRIRWFDFPKAPLSGYKNRNQALRKARGRYIAYAQDDDILFPDHFAQLVGTIKSSTADWCYSRPFWCTTDGYCLPQTVNLGNPDELHHFLNVENNVPSCCVLHTRKALRRVDYWPEDQPRVADWRVWQNIIRTSTSKQAAYCPAVTVLHFRARWKQGPEHDPPAVVRLHTIARSADWWPPTLKLEIPAAGTEQKVFFQRITREGAPKHESISEIRAGVAAVLDRLSWMSIKQAPERTSPSRTTHAR